METFTANYICRVLTTFDYKGINFTKGEEFIYEGSRKVIYKGKIRIPGVTFEEIIDFISCSTHK